MVEAHSHPLILRAQEESWYLAEAFKESLNLPSGVYLRHVRAVEVCRSRY